MRLDMIFSHQGLGHRIRRQRFKEVQLMVY